MDDKIKNIAVFAMGAVIGSMAAWRYAKKKYAEIAQNEIDSVKKAFSDRVSYDRKVAEYANKVKECGYADDDTMDDCDEVIDTQNEVESQESDTHGPYVIAPEEFGEYDDYNKISLIYYADQVLAYENDELIEDVENAVGFDSLNHFGEYEDDSVFVRNDSLKCDYEILLDHRKYSDVVKKRPY